MIIIYFRHNPWDFIFFNSRKKSALRAEKTLLWALESLYFSKKERQFFVVVVCGGVELSTNAPAVPAYTTHDLCIGTSLVAAHVKHLVYCRI